MIGSFRNFAKTKFAGLLVFIMIIPFVFWGMGGMFSSGNTNNVAKINKLNISTQDLINHINRSNIPDKTIRENLDKNILEELLSTLISSTLLDLEIEDFNIKITKEILLKKIKADKKYVFSNKDKMILDSLKSDGVTLDKKFQNLYEYDPNIPTDLQVLINNEDMGMLLLRLAEIVGEDSIENLGTETLYFIIAVLNETNLDTIRNKILLKVLPTTI